MAQVALRPGEDDAAIAAWLAERLATALADRPGGIAITVPGGATPFPIIAELARRRLDWRRVTIWPGDERLVPADHPASNIGRLRAAFGETGARFVPLAEGAQPPPFALAWLGMGADGHIASLFPNTDPRGDEPSPVLRLTPDPLPPEAPFERLSLTLPVLATASELMFVIRGEAKRALFQAALRGEHDLPVARLLRLTRAPITCFC